MPESLTRDEHQVLTKTISEVNEQGWGISFGFLLGLGLMLATDVLVLKGGPNPGRHLGMLHVYFPGYSVTFLGGFVGFVYAFVIGYGAGRSIVSIYNRLTASMR